MVSRCRFRKALVPVLGKSFAPRQPIMATHIRHVTTAQQSQLDFHLLARVKSPAESPTTIVDNAIAESPTLLPWHQSGCREPHGLCAPVLYRASPCPPPPAASRAPLPRLPSPAVRPRPASPTTLSRPTRRPRMRPRLYDLHEVTGANLLHLLGRTPPCRNVCRMAARRTFSPPPPFPVPRWSSRRAQSGQYPIQCSPQGYHERIG